jgi:Ca-activated chloride channel family protein
MIRFAQPDYLWLLVLVPLGGLFFWLVHRLRRRALERFASAMILERLAEDASRAKRVLKAALALAAIALLVVALANPQVGTRLEEVKQEGVDLFIALDVSMSMKAEDIKPNRLEKAKFEIRSLINRLSGDRIGLIVFAGEGFTQFPLTTDYNAAYLFLDVVDVDAVPVQGTSLASAIERAMESFDEEEKTTRVLVLITDGESTEGDAFDVAREASKAGILIYAIGMGSPAGAPIPVYSSSGRQLDFKRDKMGKVVLSKLDEVSLEQIASIGKGKYYRSSSTQNELDEIYEDINALQKREFGTKRFTDYEDRFQYFLGLAIVLLVLEAVISERRGRWLKRWTLFAKEEEEMHHAA